MYLKRFNPEIPQFIKKLLSIINKIIIILFIGMSLFVLSNRLFINLTFGRILQKIENHLFYYPATAVSNTDDVVRYIKGMFTGLLSDKSIYPSVDLKITQTNILKLMSTLDKKDKVFVGAEFTLNDNKNQETLIGKVRLKGDRDLHKESLDLLSYRVNLKGDDRIFGMEEFSIQRPLMRGYTWELLISEIFKREGFITIKSIPVNFSVNGDRRGIYVFEEVPSIRTVERYSKKAGPIFGLNEEVGTHINSELDVYDQKEWNNTSLYDQAKDMLELQFSSALNGVPFSEDIFDFDEWARYFALHDLFGSYHGTVPKSVKFYFNPVVGKFQPILFDSHKGAGKFSTFILSDLLFDQNAVDAEWLTLDNSFYLAFLQNSVFYSKYKKYLTAFSTDEFVEKIYKIYTDDFEQLDNLFYARLSRNDASLSRGNSFYIFKFSEIERRKQLILQKLDLIEKKINYVNFKDKTIDKIESDIDVDVTVNIENLSDFNFKGTSLTYNKPTILRLSGKNTLSGLSKDSPLIIEGPVMIVQENGNLIIDDVKVVGAMSIPVANRNWSGAINIISSDTIINNLTIDGNDSEDAINFVNSKFTVKNIVIKNSRSDAIDFDFSEGTITSVNCVDIGNDCVDGSESRVSINSLLANNVADKAVSAGENSSIDIKIVELNNVALGLVSKDGSILEVSELHIGKVQLAASAFTKKPEYDHPSLSIQRVYGNQEDIFALVSDESTIDLPASFHVERASSVEIEKMMYGRLYGAATVK